MIEFAYAATSGTANPSGGGMSILMIVLMVAIFYFMLIRPESKRKKQAEEMRSSLQKGDWLTTIGGVYGRIVAITDPRNQASVRVLEKLGFSYEKMVQLTPDAIELKLFASTAEG